MSIPVPLDELSAAMEDYGFAVLAINGADRPHVLAVRPRLEDGVLVIDRVGRTVAEHNVSDPGVTLMFPPRADDGQSLIVDAVRLGVIESTLTATPVSAILHRPV